MADWAAKNKIKKVVTLVSEYGPGFDADPVEHISVGPALSVKTSLELYGVFVL